MGFPRNFLSTPWLPVKQEAAYIDAFTKRKGPTIQSPCLLSDNVERMRTLLPIKRSYVSYMRMISLSGHDPDEIGPDGGGGGGGGGGSYVLSFQPDGRPSNQTYASYTGNLHNMDR